MWEAPLLRFYFLSSHPKFYGASLVTQWLRIRLPMQGTQDRALVWEDSHMPRSN